jgi:hypothetical protein
MNKIYIRVFAGLGNQQFQYAHAKSIALKYNKILVIDNSYFLKRYHPTKAQGFYYPFKLSYLNIYDLFSNGVMREFIGFINTFGKLKRLYQYLFNKRFSFGFLPVILDQTNFDECWFLTNRPIILADYFQNSSIFEFFSEKIRLSLTYSGNITNQNQKYLEYISSPGCTVSIHIRRGDYVEKNYIGSVYASVSLKYYRTCVEEINKVTKVARYIIFSDDILWAQENLLLNGDVLYVENDGPDYVHQYLMSRCSHNIISNSTFSWWGAWLNPNPNKNVFVPLRWFSNEARSTEIYIPNNWIKIEN